MPSRSQFASETNHVKGESEAVDAVREDKDREWWGGRVDGVRDGLASRSQRDCLDRIKVLERDYPIGRSAAHFSESPSTTQPHVGGCTAQETTEIDPESTLSVSISMCCTYTVLEMKMRETTA